MCLDPSEPVCPPCPHACRVEVLQAVPRIAASVLQPSVVGIDHAQIARNLDQPPPLLMPSGMLGVGLRCEVLIDLVNGGVVDGRHDPIQEGGGICHVVVEQDVNELFIVFQFLKVL